MSDKKRDVTEAWDEAKARPIRDSLNAVEVGTYIDGLHTTGDALRAALTTERSKHTETTREALEFSQAQGDTNRKLRAEVERWRDDALRLREGAARMDDEVCQTLGEALGFPWYKDDQENFPGATLRHGVCVGDHVAESLAVEAAHEIERLRAENERLRLEVHAAESNGDAFLDEIDRLRAQLAEVGHLIPFLRSVILCNEPWTAQCDEVYARLERAAEGER